MQLDSESKQQKDKGWRAPDDYFQQIVEGAWDMYCVLDPSGELLYASRGYDRVVGFVPASVAQIMEHVDSEYRMDLRKLFLKALHIGSRGKLEFRCRRMEESWIWMESVAIPVKKPDGSPEGVIVLTNEITARKQYEMKMTTLAYHDPLTGLPNRRLFREHLNQALMQSKRSGKTLALIYMDIDDFKVINDTMGHSTGDEFLRIFSKRIKGCLREIDMFARMGGDEFTLILPAVESTENAAVIAKRIYQSLGAEWEIEEHRFHATVSMGIAMVPDNGQEAAILMKNVDFALYDAKNSGGNHYRFY